MASDSSSSNGSVPSTSPTAALFQKAHTKMVTLQRLDEQLTGLLEQRKKLQDELRGVQALINEEFDRVVVEAQEAPARLVAQFNDPGKSKRNGKDSAILREVAEAL
jgi:hypothetical protein